jgi:hypothetical protein
MADNSNNSYGYPTYESEDEVLSSSDDEAAAEPEPEPKPKRRELTRVEKAQRIGPGRARSVPCRLFGLSVSHRELSFYGAFVWACKSLNGPLRWVSARAAEVWGQIDEDGNGVLDREELEVARPRIGRRCPAAPTCAPQRLSVQNERGGGDVTAPAAARSCCGCSAGGPRRSTWTRPWR